MVLAEYYKSAHITVELLIEIVNRGWLDDFLVLGGAYGRQVSGNGQTLMGEILPNGRRPLA